MIAAAFASFGVSVVLQNIAQMAFGFLPKGTNILNGLNSAYQVGSVSISKLAIVTVVVMIAVVVLALVIGFVVYLTGGRYESTDDAQVGGARVSIASSISGRVVEIDVRDAGAHWEFAIKDDGPGIPAQHHDRIWGIFKTTGAKDRQEGTGIGLAIVRRVVEAKGANLTVAAA